MNCFGHLTTPWHLHITTKTTETVRRHLGYPMKVSKRRLSSDLCNFYRPFIQKFQKFWLSIKRGWKRRADKIRVQWKWATHGGQLETDTSCPPVLAVPRPDGHFVVDTDANNEHVSSVLKQEQNSEELRPNGHYLRDLKNAKMNYNTTQKVCLAVVWAVLLLHSCVKNMS